MQAYADRSHAPGLTCVRLDFFIKKERTKGKLVIFSWYVLLKILPLYIQLDSIPADHSTAANPYGWSSICHPHFRINF